MQNYFDLLELYFILFAFILFTHFLPPRLFLNFILFYFTLLIINSNFLITHFNSC